MVFFYPLSYAWRETRYIGNLSYVFHRQMSRIDQAPETTSEYRGGRCAPLDLAAWLWVDGLNATQRVLVEAALVKRQVAVGAHEQDAAVLRAELVPELALEVDPYRRPGPLPPRPAPRGDDVIGNIAHRLQQPADSVGVLVHPVRRRCGYEQRVRRVPYRSS